MLDSSRVYLSSLRDFRLCVFIRDLAHARRARQRLFAQVSVRLTVLRLLAQSSAPSNKRDILITEIKGMSSAYTECSSVLNRDKIAGFCIRRDFCKRRSTMARHYAE